MSIAKKHLKSAWKAASKKEEKTWGHEVIWCSVSSRIHGKVLHLLAGKHTSFKKNTLKDETLFFLSGKAKVRYGNEMSLQDPVANPLKVEIFEPGSVLNIQSNCPYQITAIEDCQIIEIGHNMSSQGVKISEQANL